MGGEESHSMEMQDDTHHGSDFQIIQSAPEEFIEHADSWKTTPSDHDSLSLD